MTASIEPTTAKMDLGIIAAPTSATRVTNPTALDYMTTEQAADQIGVKPATIRKYIERKLITATKLGRDYLIERAELDRFKRERRSPGRPSKATYLVDVRDVRNWEAYSENMELPRYAYGTASICISPTQRLEVHLREDIQTGRINLDSAGGDDSAAVLESKQDDGCVQATYLLDSQIVLSN